MYGKATETAIAAMSRLAEVWDGGKTRVSADDIARVRNLQRPFVAKVLTTLSQHGLVLGSRGPGGGFTLAIEPKKIKLYDVFRLFEREDRSNACPFGGGTCGVGDPCPLHHKLVKVNEAIQEVLHHSTFEEFRVAGAEGRATPAKKRSAGKRRESFRASEPK
jgi:Rrf2 family iron-sulfur cluster assembly transcriptional regulator